MVANPFPLSLCFFFLVLVLATWFFKIITLRRRATLQSFCFNYISESWGQNVIAEISSFNYK